MMREAQDLFWELHSDLPREAPGSDDATRHVASLLPKLHTPRILDIGCGPGMQTLCLAHEFDGTIVAVDRHQPFLDVLEDRAAEAGLQERIRVVNALMESLPFDDATFDLIWAEGAVYCMGFENGISAWRRLLVEGGFLVVSELTWLSDELPTEPVRFWAAKYPQMQSERQNIETISRCGYETLATYVLPQSSWFPDYYDPLEARIDKLCAKYRAQAEIISFLEGEHEEISLFRRYGTIYGYVFYLMRKPGVDLSP